MFVKFNRMFYFFTLCCAFWLMAEASIDEADERSDQRYKNMTACEIIQSHGYPCEIHHTTTDDGYIIEIHRIPYGRETPESDDKVVVLLQHGLLCSSDNWLLVGPERGLAFILADNNYDVWMPNHRGTKYSRHHVNLTTEDPEFWDFSWHELGCREMPNVVDFIVGKTGQTQLLYVGHSQGTTVALTYGSCEETHMHAEKNIKAFYLLAPVAFMKHAKSPIFRLGAALEKLMPEIRSEFPPNEEKMRKIASALCAVTGSKACSNLLFTLMGYDNEQTDDDDIPPLLDHTPAGNSIEQIIHYCQLGDKWVFRQYDHGLLKNEKVYGQPTPPDYKLNLMKVPTFLYKAANDWLSGLKDVEKLEEKHGNLAGSYLVPHPKFNHLDFLIAIDVIKLVYNKLLEQMEKMREEMNKKTR